MNAERFGTLAAELWRAIEANDRAKFDQALAEIQKARPQLPVRRPRGIEVGASIPKSVW